MTLFLRFTFPVAHTQHARDLLDPYLPHDPAVRALTTPDPTRRRLWLHPRIASPADLPADLRQDCEALGSWDSTEHDLAEAERVRLFTVVFFSKSKLASPLRHGLPRNWRQALSNFYPSNLTIEGTPYASIEHYFQGQKALCSDRPELADRFRADAADGVGPDALDAKKAGGRGAYKRAGATLSVPRWEARKQGVMQAALDARWEQDPLFRDVLRSTRGLALLHFERAGARSYWGGSLRKTDGMPQGENHLGKLMTALRDRQAVSSDHATHAPPLGARLPGR